MRLRIIFGAMFIGLLLAALIVLATIDAPGEVMNQEEATTQEEETFVFSEENKAKTIPEYFDDAGTPILHHPDTLGIYFSDSTTEYDKRLIGATIEISERFFDELDLPFTLGIYVASTRDEYIDLYQELFNATEEKATQQYERSRAVAGYRTGNILVNIARNDEIYSSEMRDAAIVFATLHEFYHIAQAKLSHGFVSLLQDPLSEITANMGAYRMLIDTLCVPSAQTPNTTIQNLLNPQNCDKDFIREQIFDSSAIQHFSGKSGGYAMNLYILDTYGLEGYDALYRAYGTFMEARPIGSNFEETMNYIIEESVKLAFGVESIKEFEENILSYLAANSERIISDLEEKYPDTITRE